MARHQYLRTAMPDYPEEPPPLADAQVLPYPGISYISHDSAASEPAIELRAVQGNPRSKTVHWQTLDCIGQPAHIAALAVEAASQGAYVLVVRNTVATAVATLQAVEQLAHERGVDCLFKINGYSTLHHSRFSRQDRPLLDAQVQAQMGKHRTARPGGAGLVIVGTQTLEQSLDIDADLLITDLCPMDVLLQRLGRLHRHDRLRPPGCTQPRAWVLTPEGHQLAPLLDRAAHGLGLITGSRGGVYPDLRILEATRRLIAAAPTRDIPADNRLLVECATHPHALQAIEQELGQRWTSRGQEVDGQSRGEAVIANLAALVFDTAFEDTVMHKLEDDLTPGSRLGMTDRLLEFDPAPHGPFGQRVRELAIPAYQLPSGLSASATAQDVVQNGEGGFTFWLAGSKYCYGRYGLERMSH